MPHAYVPVVPPRVGPWECMDCLLEASLWALLVKARDGVDSYVHFA